MEELLNQKYKISMEVLTPLAIGAGGDSDWVKGADYVTKDSKLFHLDMRKLRQEGVDLSRLTTFIAQKNNDSILRLIGNKLAKVTDCEMVMPDCSSDNNIKTFVKNQLTGRPLVSGSSLKGAIRSILFSEFRGNERSDRDVFGQVNDGSDFMRFVRISDFEFIKTRLVNTKIYNLQGGGNYWEGGWKHDRRRTDRSFQPDGFNTIYECLMPHQEAEGFLMLSEKLFRLYGGIQSCMTKKNEFFSHEDGFEPIDNLFEYINDHTFDYLEKERKFFTTFNQGENSDKIIGSINWLMKRVNELEPGECVLKMSAGSGFHSITGDWQYNDYTQTGVDKRTGKFKYKSRKIAVNDDKYRLMGFVKLKIVE